MLRLLDLSQQTRRHIALLQSGCLLLIRFDLGFTAAQGQQNRGVGGVAREAALLGKVATNKSPAMLTGSGLAAAQKGLDADVTSNSSMLLPGSSSSNSSRAPGFTGVSASESVYLARRDFSALDHAFSSGSVITSSGGQRLLSHQGSVKYTRGLYLAGLRGMLVEMREVRPHGTPYGHTQQLTPRLTPGQAHSKVGGEVCICVRVCCGGGAGSMGK